MEVVVSHHIDASEPDENGFHDYHYEYDLYRFSDGRRGYFVRSYVDEPEKASFLSFEEDGQTFFVGLDDRTDSLLVEAVGYLRGVGKTAFDRLSATDGYVPMEFNGE